MDITKIEIFRKILNSGYAILCTIRQFRPSNKSLELRIRI